MNGPLLTYQQLAERLGVPVGTLYAWVSQERIPYVRFSARCVRFEPDAIDAWISARRVGAQHPAS